MQIKPLCGVLLTAVLVGGTFPAALAQSTRGVEIWVDQHGAVPPVSQWFKCFRELRGKPYDKTNSQKCLASILSHSQIEKGKIIFKHYKEVDDLTFRLVSPSLAVTDIDLDVAPGDLAKVHDLLEINGNALRPGEPYDWYRQGDSRLVIDLLLRSSGRRAEITSTDYLDYQRRTARVAFKIWEGPLGEPERLTPPYGELCKIMNLNFNSLDVDDFSPVEFVKQQLKTKWLGCFSEADIQDDQAKLTSMQFLERASISADGSGDRRSVTVHLHGKPVPISKVRVRGYGLLSGLSESDVPPLIIHAGDTYRRSATSNQLHLLENSFSTGERRVKVFSDVQITTTGEAELDFSILAFSHDFVYIDGMRFDNSLPDER
jgi:hypothetical protein